MNAEESSSMSMSCLNSIAVPTLVLSDALYVLSANTAFAKVFELENQPVTGKGLVDLGLCFYNEDLTHLPVAKFSRNIDKLTRTGGDSTILGVKISSTKDIHWFNLNVSSNFKQGCSKGNYFLCFTDVTELIGRKKTYSQISQAKSEWETTVDALQDIVTIQNKEMEIVRANKKAHDLFGYKLGELTGEKCYTAFFGRQKPCEACPVTLTARDRCHHTGTINYPKVKMTFSVSSFPIIGEDGEMNRLVHVARDVSQFLKDESEKNRLIAAIEQASESVVITNTKAEVLYVNPAFEEITGYSRQEIKGKNLNILNSGKHDSQFYQSMWHTLLSKKVWRGRLTNKRKNGTLFKEDATISPVLGKDGKIVNFVALKRDVTREELLEQKLQQAMKMEALGTLAGGIAHDFNNILSAMIGYVEIAKGKLDADDPAQKDLHQVLSSGDRAVDLVKQILTFSRREDRQQFQVVRVQHIVTEIIKLLRPSLPATIELRHEVDQSCRPVCGDPGQLYQVIMNLCTNARQAIGGDHGTIVITLREIGGRENSNSQSQRKGNGAYLELSVCDTGCGIEKDKLEKIYDPFYTTKTKDQGTGLGLAVVHGIIKKHKGEIHVSSTPGRGTTFYIYLTVDARKEASVEKGAPVENGGDERILIVDDEPAVADVIAMGLKRVGYTVTTYYDSIAVAQLFRQNPKCCDLVITDMQMPNMTGAELSREILSVNKQMPIVMLTGHSEHFDRERALRLGIGEFMYKPVKRKKLLEVIRRVLGDG